MVTIAKVRNGTVAAIFRRVANNISATCRDRGDAVGSGNLQVGGQDRVVLFHKLEGRAHQKGQKDRDASRRDEIDDCAGCRLEPAEKQGEAHMLSPAHGPDRAEHPEPKKDQSSDLIAPGHRMVQEIPGYDRRRENDDLDDDKAGGDDVDNPTDPLIQRVSRSLKAGPNEIRVRTNRCVWDCSHGQPSFPVYFSSVVQASSPKRFFQSA
jgi:hypothetical protein